MRIRMRQLVHVLVLGAFLTAAAGARADRPTRTVYDSFSAPGGYTLADYNAKWSNPYGLGDMGIAPGDTRAFGDGTFYIDDAPFRSAYDFSVYDHLKYIAISNQSFAVPALGSLQFSSEIKAATPGTVPGRVVHGSYGHPAATPAAQPTRRACCRVSRRAR